MNKALLILSLIAVASAVKWTRLEGYTFDKYKTEHSKRYLNSEEEEMRKQIFESELGRVRLHNSDNTKTWKEGINHFSDRTEEERRVVLGLNSDHLYTTKENRESKRNRIMINMEDVSLPREVDWRTSGIISSVKDQGDCGSCWSFAAAETVEAYMALQSGFLSDLSQQQILECTENPLDCGGDGGCGGGTVELAWGTIGKMGGLSTEWTYPYTAYHGDVVGCQTKTANGSADGFTPVVKVLNYTVLPSNELAPVMQHIATVGPLAISVDASSWFAYESGVYNGCNQTNPDLDHAVQLVGYGVDQINGPYWLVRNSWNPSWGEQGYIRLYRETSDADVLCGLDIKPLDGDGCKADPTPEKVCGTCGILYDNVFPVVESIWQ